MKKRCLGFTLVEVTLVLVIAGLILSGMVAMYKSMQVNTAINATKTREDAVKTALISFISRNNRLPCPAQPDLASGAALYGHEAATPGTCTNTVTAGATIAVGILPWLDMGISDEDAQDAYYHRFTYAVTLTATNLTADTVAVMKGVMNVYAHKPVAGSVALNPTSPAAVVIVSHGANGYGAYLPNGLRMGLPPGDDETENTNADVNWVKGTYSEVSSNPFDDIVVWLTPDNLLTPLAKDGAIPSARSMTNDRLNEIRDGIATKIVNNVGSIPTSMPPPYDTLLDLWGNQYNYLPGLTAVCGALPNLTAFKVSSKGPDGNLNTSDDITVSQSNDTLKIRVQLATTGPCS